MKLSIDTILKLRLFAIRHTEHEKVYFQHLKETADLIQEIESGEVNYQMEDGLTSITQASVERLERLDLRGGELKVVHGQNPFHRAVLTIYHFSRIRSTGIFNRLRYSTDG